MNLRRTRPRVHQRGFLLVVTLFTMVIVATLTIGMTLVSALDLRLINNHIQGLRAYYLAEAGVADAVARIRQSGPLPDSTWPPTAFPPGSADRYRVTVANGSRTLRCTGTTAASAFTRSLQVQVRISGTSAPYAVSIVDWRE